jgi:hypothetical protein
MGVWNCARAAADLLKAMSDKLIVAGMAVLAGWMTSWTGVGPSVSASVAIYEVREILKLYDEMGGWMSKAHTAVVSFIGWLQSDEADTLNEIQTLPMPATNYEHPDAKPEKAGPRMKGETL